MTALQRSMSGGSSSVRKHRGWAYITSYSVGFLSTSTVQGKHIRKSLPLGLFIILASLAVAFILFRFSRQVVLDNVSNMNKDVIFYLVPFLGIVWFCFFILPLIFGIKTIRGFELSEDFADLKYPLVDLSHEWYLDKTGYSLVHSSGIPRFTFDQSMPDDLFPEKKLQPCIAKPPGYWGVMIFFVLMTILGLIAWIGSWTLLMSPRAIIQDLAIYLFGGGAACMLLFGAFFLNYSTTHEKPAAFFPVSWEVKECISNLHVRIPLKKLLIVPALIVLIFASKALANWISTIELPSRPESKQAKPETTGEKETEENEMSEEQANAEEGDNYDFAPFSSTRFLISFWRWQLHVYDVNASRDTTLLKIKDNEAIKNVKWSPNGEQIACLLEQHADDSKQYKIIVFELLTGEYRILPNYELVNIDSGINWAPDDESLVFEQIVDETSKIQSLDLSTGEITTLVSQPQFPYPRFYYAPIWTKDDALFYLSLDSTLYRKDIDDPIYRQISETENVKYFTTSYDEGYIYYVVFNDTKYYLYQYDVDEIQASEVIVENVPFHFSISPSPDGKRLLIPRETGSFIYDLSSGQRIADSDEVMGPDPWVKDGEAYCSNTSNSNVGFHLIDENRFVELYKSNQAYASCTPNPYFTSDLIPGMTTISSPVPENTVSSETTEETSTSEPAPQDETAETTSNNVSNQTTEIPALNDLNVLVIKYFPLREGKLDTVSAIQDTYGEYNFTLEEIRERTDELTSEVIAALSQGTRYHGYKDESSKAYLGYKIVETLERLEAIPFTENLNNGLPLPDYMQMMQDIDVCSFVDEQNVREIWLWDYGGTGRSGWESNFSSSLGDISNSNRNANDLPLCSHSYTVYDYNYGRGVPEAIEDHMHQFETVFRYLSPELFWDLYVGTENGGGRCGWAHIPPNGTQDYDWSNQTAVPSDCEDWRPDSTGKKKNLSCSTWNCTSLDYFVWWMQNIPNQDNDLTYEGKELRNWWDFILDFDQALQTGSSLAS